jgi:hypothetical protein
MPATLTLRSSADFPLPCEVGVTAALSHSH